LASQAAHHTRSCLAAGLLAPAIVIVAMATSAAAECQQADARYVEQEGGFTLRFGRVGATEPASTTDAFTIENAERGLVFEGYVLLSEGLERPVGLVMYNCPEGDVTGAELSECTLWQGTIYALSDAGDVGLLSQDGEAADRLLLADFGRAVAESNVLDGVAETGVPWDLFEFAECAQAPAASGSAG
jgi:hypothetical protein